MVSFIGKLFRKKPKPTAQFLTVKLNAKVQPLARGDLFEDPLNAILVAEGLGEVTGGGTMMADDPYGIAYCDIEVETHDLSDSTITRVAAVLAKLRAPKGSELQVPDRPPVPFGSLEGMAIFLNGTDLPVEVYKQSDINETIAALNQSLKGMGAMLGHWQGNTETALYFYGESFSRMSTAVARVLAEDPLCAQCRIEQIA